MEEYYTYKDFLFHALFASVATLNFAASLYLLLRRSNGIAPDINPPVRLRRWAAAFFAITGVSHLYWLFICYGPMEGDLFDRILLCSTLDTIFPAPILLCTMVVMLQDRRRPLWPIALGAALTCIYMLFIYFLDIRSTAFLAPQALLIGIFCFVLVRAVRQYDRWLLDNYADLEHKEVWTNIGVLATFVFISVAYGLANDYFIFEVLIEVANILLIAVLLWRVETMQSLEVSDVNEGADVSGLTNTITEKLTVLLQQYCVEQQYYLQHDATLRQLATHIGTNTHYLSQYFKQQGLTYNTYINSLRIRHFIRRYEEEVQAKHVVTASKLATQCGFRNYNTFSTAFKHFTGLTVTNWTNEHNARFHQ